MALTKETTEFLSDLGRCMSLEKAKRAYTPYELRGLCEKHGLKMDSRTPSFWTIMQSIKALCDADPAAECGGWRFNCESGTSGTITYWVEAVKNGSRPETAVILPSPTTTATV